MDNATAQRRQMGGAAHDFVRPPLRLAVKTMTTAASNGGPAGSLPRLCAHQQAHASALNDNNDKDDRVRRATKALAASNTRAMRCADSQQPAIQSSMIAGQWVMTKRAVDKSKQQPTIAH